MTYTYRGWHTVKAPCQFPAKVGGICIHVQTNAMRAPGFYYYDAWEQVPEHHQDLRNTLEYRP